MTNSWFGSLTCLTFVGPHTMLSTVLKISDTSCLLCLPKNESIHEEAHTTEASEMYIAYEIKSAYKYFSMVDVNVAFGTAPMTVSIFLPFLKIITVGMLRIPYSVATPGLSSVLSL